MACPNMRLSDSDRNTETECLKISNSWKIDDGLFLNIIIDSNILQ